MFEFYWPTETGELSAFAAAAATAVFGLIGLFAPRTSLRLNGLDLREGRADGLAGARSTGGFYAGLAIAALLLAQDWIYLALGAGFSLACFGRILSLMSDGSFSARSVVFLVVQLVLAVMPLLHVFGFLGG
ncbi:DUF4345 domain-containing protein [Rhizobium sp. TRM95111]|uniref:AGROH133_08824 family phage infection protein n=1 Tax=Rhizobium alarense TaxID=2846851 RepID=UPI001F424A5B|nr:DUF4345 domain-containing protein [Rhizobium alarense]MCF3639380.1 DUF4345 domain-containing protein [Rhizobium alarense]